MPRPNPYIYTMKLFTQLFLALLILACAREKARPVAAQVPIAQAPVQDAEELKRGEIIAFAKKYMGTAYCYASADPKKGFDCSGFVNFVFKHFDIELPRSSSGFANIGRPLKPEEFKIGDILVFYGYRDRNSIGHVGIICEANGMKSKFIHSSSGREMAVIISDLGSDMYTRRFYKCVDVIGSK
ncbi:C40 family peptidase [uncultured Flavobacterium sp.]|uniref:C40 family peptidase n=1 Tax=uncultured Flavobacterium sp. TaxID=165435 RepID=UPI0025FA10DC|nr:C40 family peptidase [uncultured Flavobacterium sp.]